MPGTFLRASEKCTNKSKIKINTRNKDSEKGSHPQTAICGVQLRTGRRQSMPSSNIDSCAGVSETVPLLACGQTKRPRSKRL
jgi:hypothetical protein